jgi:hypothetical protein
MYLNYHLKQIDESGEVHLSEAIRKIQIPSEKWDEQGILMYNMDAFDTGLSRVIISNPSPAR